MDQERFDHIARTLGCTGSRRGVVGGLLAGLVGAGIARVTDADAKGKGKGKSKTKGKGKGRNKNQGRVGAQAVCDADQRAVCEGLNACCSTLEGQGCISVATQNSTGQDGSGGPCGDPGAVCGFCAPGTRCDTKDGDQVCVCDVDSCPNGCCSNGPGNPGVCRTNGSGTPGVCGIGGQACVSCPNGCCDLAGNCEAGTEDNECGIGGGICADCGPGGSCVEHVCNTCNSSLCDGCCDKGVCRPGTSNNACGDWGNTCVKCPDGQSCLDSDFGNICAFGGCNPTTCPNGCCDGDVCRLGTDDFECGTGGAACVECGFLQECKNQICVDEPCTPQNCPDGCCDSNGLCRNGNANNSCGVRGGACVACGANEDCINGICTDIPCNASTCPNGCCDGSGTCRAGDSVQACGDGGAACQACTGENPTCVNGTCRSNPDPTCPTTFEECSGVCVDLATDKQNCGGCGIACPGCGKRKRPLCEGGTCSCRRKGGRRGRRRR